MSLEVRRELDFYLVEHPRDYPDTGDPWSYAVYHCSTGANVYSPVHWSYFKGKKDGPPHVGSSGNLRIVRMAYPETAAVSWKASCDMLMASGACDYLKEILPHKVSRRAKGTQRFFGEAFVATRLKHVEGYYGSFQWLTNERFLTSVKFPPGPTQSFQDQYRAALQRYFGGQLERLQQNARALLTATGVRPSAPDLWLIEPGGRHRFIEVKLPKDQVNEGQLAGLAVIVESLGVSAEVSVEVIELAPDHRARFDRFRDIVAPSRPMG